MNNKEFIAELAQREGFSLKDTADMVTSLVNHMTEQWEEGKQIAVSGFGTFEVKKKNERVSVNPVTQVRFLVPPKLALIFKPSNSIKQKYK